MTTGQIDAIGNGTVNGGIGLTTSQMQNPANYATTYAGWDFANVWSAPSAGYYPQLYGVNYVLRVDPANASRVYGDANPAFTYTSYGLHTGDTSAILAGLSLSTAATTTSNVGSYAITAGGSVISTTGQAYRLIQTPAALTVTPRAITVTADAKSRAYGDANPALTYQVGGAGLVNGDTLSGALATSATTASNVGVYGITQGTLASSNYTISLFTGANLTVTPARAHGDGRCEEPRLWRCQPGADLSGRRLGPGQWRHACRVRWRRRRRQPSNVGTYGITQGTLAASSNYALNYTGANLTVTPAGDHGDGRCEEPRLWRCQPGADLSGRRLGPGQWRHACRVRWRRRRQQPSNVGTYGITQGTLAASGNYALNYTGANLTVDPARAHGDGRCEEPRLWRCQSGADLSGRRLRAWSMATRLSGALATSATTASNVGTYGITQGTLAASGNYALNYTGDNLTVGQRALTVTADAKSRAYGDANPALTYQVGGSGLVNGDTLSGALATSATTASNVGTYGITQGTLAASGNYALNYTAPT